MTRCTAARDKEAALWQSGSNADCHTMVVKQLSYGGKAGMAAASQWALTATCQRKRFISRRLSQDTRQG